MKFQHFVWIGAAVGLNACAEVPSYMSLGTNDADYGYINHGERWGVMIGSSREGARQGLTKYDGRPFAQGVCDVELEKVIPCREGEAYDMYLEQVLPNVRLFYVFYQDDRVESLYWMTTSAAPFEQL